MSIFELDDIIPIDSGIQWVISMKQNWYTSPLILLSEVTEYLTQNLVLSYIL